MSLGIKYDNIHLPKKVSEMLEHDFWIINNVTPEMVKSVTSPVKFSVSTSIFLLEGECQADINLITHSIKAPCVINISSSHIMQPYNISENFRASFVVLSKRMVDNIRSAISDISLLSSLSRTPCVPLTAEAAEALRSLYGSLTEITNDAAAPMPYQAVLHSMLAYFFCFAVSCYEALPQPKVVGSYSNHLVQQFLTLVQENFKKERFLEFYASRLEITPKHLSRTLRAQTGHTAVEWINRFILLEAKVMLESSNLTIQQISEELNFPSQSIFGKFFKKATGMSPKDFRNR